MGTPPAYRMRASPELDEKWMRAGTLHDRLSRSMAGAVVGRERELALLTAQLSEDGAVVSFVHGIGGIGKSSLFAAAEPRFVAAGARVVRIDGRAVEPTPRGFLEALALALGGCGPDIEAIANEIGQTPAPCAILIDEFDRLRLLDVWLMQACLPRLPGQARLFTAGRFAPRAAWLTTPGWSDSVLTLRLDGLSDAAAREVLVRRGVPETDIPALLRVARGMPLALALVTPGMGRVDQPDVPSECTVLSNIASRSADDLPADLREAVEAASLVRRATRPLLEIMLGKPCPDTLLAELTELSFVELCDDGLLLHETVRQAIATRLRALDPARCKSLRDAVWRELDRTLTSPPPQGPSAWGLMADVLFLVEFPEIREAFFPTHEVTVSVSSAERSDAAAIIAIVERYDPPELVKIIEAWWEHLPSAFRVARDPSGEVIGFAIIATSEDVPDALSSMDPLVRAWQADLGSGASQKHGALLVRRCLSRDFEEGPSDVRAAVWLDIKRDYVSLPKRWGVYASTRHDDALLPLFRQLGFRQLPLGHGDESTVWLEFGTRGAWSWLQRLMGRHEHGGRSAAENPDRHGWRLDSRARGLVIDGAAVPLSGLEYRALGFLLERAGQVVTRDTLLEEVWQQPHSGSNVVDALVRQIRKKLGPYAASLETVRGHGYRAEPPPE